MIKKTESPAMSFPAGNSVAGGSVRCQESRLGSPIPRPLGPGPVAFSSLQVVFQHPGVKSSSSGSPRLYTSNSGQICADEARQYDGCGLQMEAR